MPRHQPPRTTMEAHELLLSYRAPQGRFSLDLAPRDSIPATWMQYPSFLADMGEMPVLYLHPSGRKTFMRMKDATARKEVKIGRRSGKPQHRATGNPRGRPPRGDFIPHRVGRINPDLPYSAKNCFWEAMATATPQRDDYYINRPRQELPLGSRPFLINFLTTTPAALQAAIRGRPLVTEIDLPLLQFANGEVIAWDGASLVPHALPD